MERFYAKGGGGEFFKFHPEAFRRYMRHHEIAEYPFDRQVFETVPGFISEMSCIRVDHQMATSVPGLFAIGDAAGSGSARAGAVPAPPAKIHGTGLLNAFFMGHKGGPAAALFARGLRDMGIEPRINSSEVVRIKEETYAPMHRESGISPRQIIYRVQDAVAPVDYSVVKREDRMKEALGIVLEAKNLLPQMSVSDFHELSRCVDARSMVICAEMFYRASLMRKESRGFHLREDYPETDDANWLKWIIVQKQGDEMTLTTEEIPFHTYDYQPQKT